MEFAPLSNGVYTTQRRYFSKEIEGITRPAENIVILFVLVWRRVRRIFDKFPLMGYDVKLKIVIQHKMVDNFLQKIICRPKLNAIVLVRYRVQSDDFDKQ